MWRSGDKSQKVEKIKLRWRVSYKLNGEVKNEMGEVPEFSIS